MAPKFAWRGYMLDVSRHFFTVDDIKKTLDLMHEHDLNVFHWHLTDGEGWRLQIDRYPKLTSVGAVRKASTKRTTTMGLDVIDGDYGPFFYTKDQVREIVRYAAGRGIRIVPEIEFPGHSAAAIRAYPELGCAGRWNCGEFCLGRESTFEIMENILDEVIDLFPGDVIHIGGDECRAYNWKVCPDCQSRIRELGLKDTHELQGWATARLAEFLGKRGRRLMGWDELSSWDFLPRSVIVQSYRGASYGVAAARKGFDVVMSPDTFCYLDYVQGLADDPEEYQPFGVILDVAKIARFDPCADVPEDCWGHILGGAGNLWAELVPDRRAAEWRTWPRLAAIADVLKNGPAADVPAFMERMGRIREDLVRRGVNAAPLGPLFKPVPDLLPGARYERLKSEDGKRLDFAKMLDNPLDSSVLRFNHEEKDDPFRHILATRDPMMVKGTYRLDMNFDKITMSAPDDEGFGRGLEQMRALARRKRGGAMEFTGAVITGGPVGAAWTRTLADGWMFRLEGEAEGRPVRVPHDWAVEGGFLKVGACPAQGDLPFVGKGFYRRAFDGFSPPPGGRTYLTLDGVQCRSTVRLNGKVVGGRPFGYASETIDVTDALMESGNVLEVEAENVPSSSRWYPGSGIFREVTVRVCPKDHVKPGTLFIQTLEATEKSATVAVTYEWRGGVKDYTFTVENPRLWSPESPSLYELELFGEKFRYGIRTAKFDPQRGFFLNGVHRQMRGVCMHHDLGPVGAAFDADFARRQLSLLREIGCDAIRTSHNPPAAALLDLCDEMGFLVMDEAFDMWEGWKGDYANFFKEWHARDLADFVRRDRSHPCVVMWSIGNELNEHGMEDPSEAIRIATELAAIVRAEDPTRPVTFACYHAAPMWNGCQNTVDAFGANYLPFKYAEFARRNPDIGLVATETSSCVSSRGEYFFPVVASPIEREEDLKRRRDEGRRHMVRGGQMSGYDLWGPHPNDCPPDVEFRFQDANPQVYGEFVWTGFDYLGEPDPCAESGGRSSYFGIFDLAGIPKDRAWLYKSHWRPDEPTAHILPHWTWPGREGEVTPVHVYSSGDEAELFVNGVSHGRRRKGEGEYRFVWDDVRYEPGEVRVKTWKDGRDWAEDSVKTAGVPARIDREERKFGRLTFVTFSLRDKDGTVCPNADRTLSFSLVPGTTLVALCNGDAASRESFKGTAMRTFHGLLVAVVEGPSDGLSVASSAATLGWRPGVRWCGFNLLGMFCRTKMAEGDKRIFGYFPEDRFQWMHEWGFNFARLPLDYRFFVEEGDWMKPVESQLKKLDDAVRFGRKYGIHVQINFHRAPGYCCNPPVEPKSLFLDPEPLAAFTNLWSLLARRYRGIPNEELSFDLVNEPAPVAPYGTTPGNYAAVARAALAAIRAVDPDRFVMSDGWCYGKEPLMELHPFGPMAGESIHCYEPHLLTHYKVGNPNEKRPCPPWPLEGWTDGVEWLERYVVKLWQPAIDDGTFIHAGELGCHQGNVPHATYLAWLEDTLRMCARHGWGWALWNLDGTFGILDTPRTDCDFEDFHGHKLDRKALDLLLKYSHN